MGQRRARADRALTVAHKPNVITAAWMGGHRFDTGRPDGPVARLDGTAHSGQSPPDALLSALAACSGIDLVDILAKRRTPVERLVIDVEGERRETTPRRFQHLRIVYRVDGAGIDAVHAERAVALAFEKYCSVAASLAPDTIVETRLILNGVEHDAIKQLLGR
jgi:putative redox protein